MKTILYCITLTLMLLNNVMAQNIDTKHVSLHLSFDWQKRKAMGTAYLTLSLMRPDNKIYLDAGNLSISSVLLEDKVLEYSYDGGDKEKNLAIFLDKVYTPTENIILKIVYQTKHENRSDPNAIWGSFGKGLRFQEPTLTTPNKRKQIWSSGEPNNNKYWFPCNEDIADIHTSEIIATIGKPLMVISNGSLIEKRENDDNTTTFHYKTEKPFPNYLVSIVIGEYVDVLQNSHEVSIHNYGYPEEKEAIKATTELLPDMMRFLEEKTAYNYPYKQYTQVVVQDYPFPGLVGQHSVSTISDNYIDDSGVHKDFKYLWDGVAMQALANQWFGNLLMPKSWEDIWLNNAFAQFFADLYTTENNSLPEYLSYGLPFEKSNFFNEWNSGNKHPIATNKIKDLNGFTSDSYSKYIGALVLRRLQNEIGNINWWKAIQLYIKTNANKQVGTIDFQKAIEQTTGKSYQWFFDEWVYKIGLPKLEVTKHYNKSKKQLTIQVKQIQKNDSICEYEQVKYFMGKMKIEIDNKVIQVNIEPKKENDFTFSMADAPEFVNFNYEETWLCETEYKQSLEEYLFQLEKSQDVCAKQKALDKLLEIAKDSSTAAHIKNKIEAAFKNEITSNLYWRYRLYALGSLRKMLVLPYNQETIDLLLNLIKKEKSWLKTSAIFTLGNTLDEKYFDLYKQSLNDESDRVINAAAIALGKTKNPMAFDVLIELDNKPSWKSQSRISALNGLEQLNDTRALDYVLNCLKDNRSPRWYLATPVWDYPFAAANTLVSMGKADLAYSVLIERLKQSLQENDINDIFQLVQLIAILKDERATEMFILLKKRFAEDKDILEKINAYETSFLDSIHQ